MTDPLYKTELCIHQDKKELAAFIELLVQQHVNTYLEIGSKFGGSLYAVGEALPRGSRLVAVDLPGGTRRWHESSVSLEMCCNDLRKMGQELRLIWGDSTDPLVVEQVKRFAPFDCVLIDANHTLPFLAQDFANYAPMARMVAFHDISWRRPPEFPGAKIDVPAFWDQVKQEHRFVEFRCPDSKNKDNGIGVMWR